jgi:hypothetical protein
VHQSPKSPKACDKGTALCAATIGHGETVCVVSGGYSLQFHRGCAQRVRAHTCAVGSLHAHDAKPPRVGLTPFESVAVHSCAADALLRLTQHLTRQLHIVVHPCTQSHTPGAALTPATLCESCATESNGVPANAQQRQRKTKSQSNAAAQYECALLLLLVRAAAVRPGLAGQNYPPTRHTYPVLQALHVQQTSAQQR